MDVIANQLSLQERLKIYWRITELGALRRRYIVIGAFDGALTIVAIVLAALAAAVLLGMVMTPNQVTLLVRASLSAGVGLAISSGWCAYEAERVERKKRNPTHRVTHATTYGWVYGGIRRKVCYRVGFFYPRCFTPSSRNTSTNSFGLISLGFY
ncbi:MAG: hypothetical protein ACXADB_14105, partial [Candidatus Hermodarchaeia archaeon]